MGMSPPSVKFIEALIDQMSNGVAVYDRELHFVTANNYLRTRFLTDRDAVRGMHMLEVRPELEGTERYEEYKRIAREGGSVSFKGVVLDESQKQRQVNINVYEQDGLIFLVSKDVTSHELRLTALSQISEELFKSNSFDEVYGKTLEIIQNTLGYRYAGIALVRSGQIQYVDYIGFEELEAWVNEINGPGIIARTARMGESQLVRDTRSDPDFIQTEYIAMDAPAMLSELTAPIVIDDQIFGILNIESELVNAFDEQDQRLLGILASTVASALRRLQIEAELKISNQRLRELVDEIDQDLSQTEKLFKGIYENSAAGIVLQEIGGMIVTVNPSFEEMVGYTEEDLKRMVYREYTYSDDLDIDTPLWNDLLTGNITNYVFEKRYQHRDGSLIWARVTVSLIRDGEGNSQYSVAVIEDITDFRRAMNEIEFNNALMKAQLDSSPAAISVVDKEGKLLLYNDNYVKIFGLEEDKSKEVPLDELRRRAADDMVDPEGFIRGVEDYYSNLFKAGIDEIRFKDGRRYERSTVPLIDNENVYHGRLWHFYDITEIINLQDELNKAERLASIGRIVSIVGHDLRNPLGVINNAVFFLKKQLEGSENEKVDRSIEIIENEIQTCKSIITDLLDFARGPRQPYMDLIEVDTLVEETVIKLSSLNKREVDMSFGVVESTRLDSQMMKRILTNLINNAFDATLLNKESVSVSTRLEGEKVVIAVKDEGVGIPEGMKDKMYTPLFSTKNNGTGLGLYITRQLVEAQGGEISFETQEGKGTTFTVAFPKTS